MTGDIRGKYADKTLEVYVKSPTIKKYLGNKSQKTSHVKTLDGEINSKQEGVRGGWSGRPKLISIGDLENGGMQLLNQIYGPKINRKYSSEYIS